MSEQTKSNVPMILGIIGFVAMIPGLLCASACGALVSAGGEGGTGTFIILLTALPMLVGFVFSFMSKSKPKVTGIVMLISAIVLLIPVVMSGNFFFGLIAFACYLIGGILSFQNK